MRHPPKKNKKCLPDAEARPLSSREEGRAPMEGKLIRVEICCLVNCQAGPSTLLGPGVPSVMLPYMAQDLAEDFIPSAL